MVLIFQHMANESAGTLEDYLKLKKLPFKYVKFHENEMAPVSMDHLKALIILGGPMNVYEEDTYLFLKPETEFIRKAVLSGIPCLGICLGAQLIAKALGAKVYKAKSPEIGWDQVKLASLASKDALFSSFKEVSLKVFQWHEDTFDLPAGAVHLAESSRVKNQAYRVNEKTYGFQFHIEVNRLMLQNWFKNHSKRNEIIKEYEEYEPALNRISREIYNNFFNFF